MPSRIRPPKIAEAELAQRVLQAVTSGRYRILPHARQRCTERDAAAADIENVLDAGHRVRVRDRFEGHYAAWSYGYEGKAIDGEQLRVVVAFEDWMLVVTVIRLNESKED